MNFSQRISSRVLRWLFLLALPLGPVALGACGRGEPAASLPVGVMTPAQAWRHVGEQATVRFKVAKVGRSVAGSQFLNEKVDYQHGFVAVIFSGIVSKFPFDPGRRYEGRVVDVVGLVSSYGGHPEIKIFDPRQIELVR